MMAYNLCYCTLVILLGIFFLSFIYFIILCSYITSLRSLFPIILSLKVTPEDVRKLNLPPEHINKTPSGETFVKQSLQKVATFWIDYSQILLGTFLKKYISLRAKRIIYFRVYFQRFLKSSLVPVKELKQI